MPGMISATVIIFRHSEIRENVRFNHCRPRFSDARLRHLLGAIEYVLDPFGKNPAEFGDRVGEARELSAILGEHISDLRERMTLLNTSARKAALATAQLLDH